MSWSVHLANAEDTQRWGRCLASLLKPGHLLTLRGSLGAGKTTLVKGLVAALTELGVDDVVSPTFTIAQEYDEGPEPILHLDAYRLNSDALIDLGFLDWLEDGRHIILLEWPEKVEDALPEECLDLELSLEGSGRCLEVFVPESETELLANLKKAWTEGETSMASKVTKIVLVGAPGRMAQRVACLAESRDDFELVAALARPGSDYVGVALSDCPGFPDSDLVITDTLKVKGDVVIDFTSAAATVERLSEWIDHDLPLLVGSTGLSDGDWEKLNEASLSIPILVASNTSLGINLLEGLVEKLAKTLGDDYDIEIVESHHRHKKDAPSGTAKTLARAAARGREVSYEERAVHGREGNDAQRKRGDIGMHSLRMGAVVGEHRVYFCNAGERIEIAHSALSRDTFALGALKAARYLAQTQLPALLCMKDVLGLA